MSERTKIFLVDDDLMFTEAIEHFMKTNIDGNLDIYKYSTGDDCLANLDKKPDLLILDYYLEEKTNGIDVLKKIKEYNTDINVIILTGLDDAAIAVDVVNAGADYLNKSDSAFIKIKKNIITLQHHKTVTKKLKKQVNIYKKINIAVVAMLILLFILSRLL